MPKQKGIQGFDQLRLKLRNAPEKMRLRELYSELRTEATPVRDAARQEAYSDPKGKTTKDLWKSIKITRARVRNWRDMIGVWIGPTRVSSRSGDAQAYPFMQLYGSTARNYEARDYMGKAWERLGSNTQMKIDRLGKSRFRQRLRAALQ